MAKVFANDHDATFAADDLALIADLLNAWLHLHLFSFLPSLLLLCYFINYL
jgi:hypothetical protein